MIPKVHSLCKVSASLLMTLMIISCSESWSAQDEAFVSIYTEVLIARETFPDTLSGNKAVQKILEKYGQKESDFANTFQLYAQNPDKLRALMDSVRNRIEQKLAKSDTLNKHP